MDAAVGVHVGDLAVVAGVTVVAWTGTRTEGDVAASR